jgi:hypothetical protein
MSWPGSRKLGQVPHTSRAVNAIHRSHAEPERTAPFTYLQVQAQVIHFIPFQGVFFPGKPQCFSTVEGAHSAAMECHPTHSQGSTASSIKFQHSSVDAQCGVVPWEKFKIHRNIPPPFGPIADTRFQPFSKASGCFSVPSNESFKVIALDNLSVNTNLSSSFATR